MTRNRRREERQRRRLTCQVLHEGKRHRGIVIDLSPTGLFIQTSVPISPGSEVGVEFPEQAGSRAFQIRARVARRRSVPPRLASLMSAGIGLRVLDPPEAFTSLVRREQSMQDDGAAIEPVEAPPLPRYRIRVTQRGSPRSRTLVLAAKDEGEARARVSRDLGAGWDVVELEAED